VPQGVLHKFVKHQNMRLRFILAFLLLEFCCVQQNKPIGDVFLTLPFGKYYTWTNYELKQMNFKIDGNKLLIDTTYELKSGEFNTHYIERREDYPEIAKFLSKSVTELSDLQNEMNKTNCDNLHQFYFQYKNGTKLEKMTFNGTDACDPTHRRTLSSVYQEMKKIQDKYKP
jgi:hypothetical protein